MDEDGIKPDAIDGDGKGYIITPHGLMPIGPVCPDGFCRGKKERPSTEDDG